MWDAFYNRSSQSCTAFYKKKTDLSSVEYRNYIHKDVLNYLDQYPMRQSNQKLKKGTPNTRNRASSSQETRKRKVPTPVDCNAGFRPKEGQKPTRPITSPLCKIGPICKCAFKPQEDFVTSPRNLKLTTPPSKSEKTSQKISQDTKKSTEHHCSTRESQLTKSSVRSSFLRDVCSHYSKDIESTDSTTQYETSIKTETSAKTENIRTDAIFGITYSGSCENDPICAEPVTEPHISNKEYVPPWRIYKVI